MSPDVDTVGLTGDAIAFRLDAIEAEVQEHELDSGTLAELFALERGLSRQPDAGPGMARLNGIRRALARWDDKRFAADRAKIRSGELRGPALKAAIAAAADRDEFTERLLGVRYLTVTMKKLGEELVPYVPSGVDAVQEALAQASVGPSDTFVDLGSGCGKVALLANLLTGAKSVGVELQTALAEFATSRATDLGATDVRFLSADARECLPEGTVYFMYLPFSGQVLEDVMAQMKLQAQKHPIRVCALGVELGRYDWLTPIQAGHFWLTTYQSVP